MSEFQLMREIVALSQASTWDKAKLECELESVYEEEEPDTCLCGHFPINEICVIATADEMSTWASNFPFGRSLRNLPTSDRQFRQDVYYWKQWHQFSIYPRITGRQSAPSLTEMRALIAEIL